MERDIIKKLFDRLEKQPKHSFPKPHQHLDAPRTHGVYLIRSPVGEVLHVGRTHRAQKGLSQRLHNHLLGQSSFVGVFLSGQGDKLRDGYTFQYLKVSNDRKRALLEHFATAWYCPKHLGVGAHRTKK